MPDPTGEMFGKLLHIFDEHQSRETAKHVHRAILRPQFSLLFENGAPRWINITNIFRRLRYDSVVATRRLPTRPCCGAVYSSTGVGQSTASGAGPAP